jgi:uroporphyrinogen-III synthase
MRVLITRPEREATALATALVERGHAPVIAPLFELAILRPPAEFAAALAACQAVLITSANGARALAEASEQRSRPVFAVGDTTAATAEGLGFGDVVSASGDGAALAELVRRRLDPKNGALVHASGVDVAGELALPDFEVRRFALYEAREATTLPDSARAALEARALDAAMFFSPRASALFAKLAAGAGLANACRSVTAIAISPAAAGPLDALPFKAVRAAHRPTRQAVLDEIDRLAEVGVQEEKTMSDTPSPASNSPPPRTPQAAVPVRRGLGVFGAFVVGLIASAIVLAGALFSLPYWPQEAREMWRGPPVQIPAPPAPPPAPPAPKVDVAGPVNAAVEAAKHELNARLDDLEKRVRAAATTAARADKPDIGEAALADLRARIEALQNKPAGNPDIDKELADLRKEIAALRDAARQAGTDEQNALAAARASAIVGIAARLSAAVEQGLPFAAELALLPPLAQGNARLDDAIAVLRPLATRGVAARTTLVNEFPAMAKAALAEDLADDSLGQRVLGKIKAIVSLRRVGDVEGDTAEARLARAEAALNAGDIAKAVGLVKALPPQTSRATAAWLGRAEAHLAAQRAVDQLAAEAVALLGAARR